MRRRTQFAVSVTATLAVLGSACAAGDDESSNDAAFEEVGNAIDGESGGAEGSGGAVPGAEEADELVATAGDDVSRAPSDPADTSESPATTSDVGLRAGSVDDNERWDDYLLYLQQFEGLGIPVHPIDVSGRQVITVTDDEGRPVLGARVEVLDEGGSLVADLRTHADGRTLFHAPTTVDPDSQQRATHQLRVTKGGASETLDLDPESSEHTVTIDASTVGSVAVDVLFLIDTTGSMGDEIARLQANVASVAEDVAALPSSGDVRFGMTLYRDRGDEYVTRTFDFTEDVTAFDAALDDVVANGGGDTPEDLNAGLHDALTEPSWRGDDTLKLVFLIADAPPHLDYDGPDYAEDVLEAARLGIKVVPVASSGLDDQGEYVFRQLAQITMGTFVFLTYGADGLTPGDATPHNVDDFSVLALDALVVALIEEELAHQAA
jgi:hypothetical protein